MANKLEQERLANWLIGKKRTSRHSNEPFLTRKDRRLFDRQFFGSKISRVRSINPFSQKKTRRAKGYEESKSM